VDQPDIIELRARSHGAARARDKIKRLSDEDRAKIASVETFQTVGTTRARALEYLNTEDGRIYIQSLKEADPRASDKIIVDRAVGQIRSGKEPPKLVNVEAPLFKIAPKGGGVSPYSPFFTTKQELEIARKSGRPLSDYFGLPASSDASVYDIYQITPKERAIGFSSKVAPTSELGGEFTTSGGGSQIVIPNRKQFTEATRVGSIIDN